MTGVGANFRTPTPLLEGAVEKSQVDLGRD